METIDLDTIKKFKISVGTVYHFQGSERDIILYSLGLADTSHHSAFRHVMEERVFNVSITRAKSKQIVFKSISEDVLKKHSLLSEYFTFIDKYSQSESEQEDHDIFQKEIIQALTEYNDLDIYSGYPMAGMELDLLVRKNGAYFFIDLIGYPGKYQEAFSIERYRVLARIGIQIIPINWNYWKNNSKSIKELLNKYFR